MRRVPAERAIPLRARLDPSRPEHAAALAAHEDAMARGEDSYLDPSTGYLVFTAQSHWDRGSCCHSGCRHCPFEDGPRIGTGQSRRGRE